MGVVERLAETTAQPVEIRGSTVRLLGRRLLVPKEEADRMARPVERVALLHLVSGRQNTPAATAEMEAQVLAQLAAPVVVVQLGHRVVVKTAVRLQQHQLRADQAAAARVAQVRRMEATLQAVVGLAVRAVLVHLELLEVQEAPVVGSMALLGRMARAAVVVLAPPHPVTPPRVPVAVAKTGILRTAQGAAAAAAAVRTRAQSAKTVGRAASTAAAVAEEDMQRRVLGAMAPKASSSFDTHQLRTGMIWHSMQL